VRPSQLNASWDRLGQQIAPSSRPAATRLCTANLLNTRSGVMISFAARVSALTPSGRRRHGDCSSRCLSDLASVDPHALQVEDVLCNDRPMTAKQQSVKLCETARCYGTAHSCLPATSMFVLGGCCSGTDSTGLTPSVGDAPNTATVHARPYWNDIGLEIRKGAVYRFSAQGTWYDAGHPASAEGHPSLTFIMRWTEGWRRVPARLTLSATVGRSAVTRDCGAPGQDSSTGTVCYSRFPGPRQPSLAQAQFYWLPTDQHPREAQRAAMQLA
jgi:hypothetical protein